MQKRNNNRGNRVSNFVAYLKKYPGTDLCGDFDHLFGSRPLSLPQRNGKHPLRKLHFISKLVQFRSWVSSGGQYEYKRCSGAGILEDGRQIRGLRLYEFLTQVVGQEVLHSVGDFVRSETFKDQQFLESFQLGVEGFW